MKKKISSMLLYVIFGALLLLFAFSFGTATKSTEVSYSDFLEMVNRGDVEKVEIGSTTLTIYTYEDDKVYYTNNLENSELIPYLIEEAVEFEGKETTNNGILSYVFSLIIMLFVFTIGGIIFRTIMGGSGSSGVGIMSVGKNRSKMYMDKDTGVTFNDVAGEDEAKESLNEIIDYLHNTSKYTKIGAKLPKGVLLVGPPGTGKTLLAKAVAGEAKVPFFSLSGSDFVEMFVGVGASRVRDLFETAKKHAPCIIFIDEIDAIGKARGNGVNSGGHDEREQTLNQLLTEMDGFETDKAVIVLAATNRPEVLDKALLRPGRFDRRVIVDKPDLNGRIATLKVHAKNVNLDESVDMKAIALATSGAVGADLANIINEAALNAVRDGKSVVSQKDIMDAVEVVFAGKEKKDKVMSDKERKLVAYHEVGHAVVAALQKNSAPVQKITIVPRTMGALGYTMQIPEEEKYLMTREDIICETRTLLAGRCAEEVFFNVVSTGASNDIERATSQIKKAITLYGMSDVFDMVALEDRVSVYLDGTTAKTCSEHTYSLVDREVSRIIRRLHNEAKQMLISNKDMINEIANYLIEKENITGDEFMEIFRKYIKEGTEYKLNNDDVFSSDIDLMATPIHQMPSITPQPVNTNNNNQKTQERVVEKPKPLTNIKETSKQVENIQNTKNESKKEEAKKEEIKKEPEPKKEEIKTSPLEEPAKEDDKKDKAESKNDLSSLLSDITKKKEEIAKEEPKKEEIKQEEPKKEEKKLSPFELAKQKKEEQKKEEIKEKAPEIDIKVEKKPLPFEQPKKEDKPKEEEKREQDLPKPLNAGSGSSKKKKKKGGGGQNNSTNQNGQTNQNGKDDMSKLMAELTSGNLKNDKSKNNQQKPQSQPKVETNGDDDDISEDMY